jgi:hypothetical protein
MSGAGAFDYRLLLPLLLLLPLAATLRQSWPGRADCSGRLSRAVAGPLWLLPLIFIVPGSIGLMLAGDLAPLPQLAYAQLAGSKGTVIAAAAAILVLIADLWLLLTPAMVMLRHAPAGQAARLRAAIPLNIALGSTFLLLVLALRG